MSSFRYGLAISKNPISPMSKKRAVYFESKLSPVKIPAHTQQIFFFLKIASCRKFKLTVQQNINGTSGVEIKESMLIMNVETSRDVAIQGFIFRSEIFLPVYKMRITVSRVTVVSASFKTNTFFPNKLVKIGAGRRSSADDHSRRGPGAAHRNHSRHPVA